MEGHSILRVKDLTVVLDHQLIIDHLSFTVKKGEVVSILGPNGAGKSVLLKCLLGILPYKGEIKWTKGLHTSYVPQRLPFIKDVPLNIRDFFSLKNAPAQEIREILSMVGLTEELLTKKVDKLSSGQFQRLLVAWSLIGRPQVLLFDEPTTGIDIGGEETIYTLLEDLKEKWNLTILLVTHDLNVVSRYSNHVICLNQRTICMGTPREVLTPESLYKLYGGRIKYYQHKHR